MYRELLFEMPGVKTGFKELKGAFLITITTLKRIPNHFVSIKSQINFHIRLYSFTNIETCFYLFISICASLVFFGLFLFGDTSAETVCMSVVDLAVYPSEFL